MTTAARATVVPGDSRTRRMPAPASSFDPETRTFTAVAATAAPVLRSFLGERFYEILDLAGAGLGRFQSGRAPLLNAHRRDDHRDQLGVVESARLENGQLVVTCRLFDRPEAAPLAEELARGTRFNVSIGYTVLETREEPAGADGISRTKVTKWEPFELSVTPAAADPNAHTRSIERTPQMDDDEVALEERETETRRATPVTPDPRSREGRRIATIRDIGVRTGLPADVVSRAVLDGTAVEAFRERAFDHMIAIARATETSSIVTDGFGTGTLDDPDFRQRAMGEALFARTNPGHRLSDPARQFAGMSLLGMARECLQASGERNIHRRGDLLVVTRALTTSDFPIVLGAAARLSVIGAYELFASAIKPLARRTEVPDFRQYKRPRTGEFPSLDKVGENAEIKHGAFNEAGENLKVDTYAKILPVSRQMIINDDMGILDNIYRTTGQAAAACEADILAAPLNANGGTGITMSDGKAVFHTDHGNVAEPLAVGIASLSTAQLTLRSQKNMAGNYINASGRWLLVPPARETEALAAVAAITATKADDVNPFAGKLGVAVEPRLASDLAWYLFADPAMLPVIEYAYLDGGDGPFVGTEEGFDVDGIRIKVRHDFGATVSDWRGAVRNPGSSPI